MVLFFLRNRFRQSFLSSLSETRKNGLIFFQNLLSKMGFSLGSRVLLSRGLSCEGWLLLVLILSAFGIFDGTIMNMTGGNETINRAGPSEIENYESDSLIAHASREGYSDKVRMIMTPPRQSVSSASSSSTSTPESSPGQNEERDSFTYIKPGSEEHEKERKCYSGKARRMGGQWENGWFDQ